MDKNGPKEEFQHKGTFNPTILTTTYRKVLKTFDSSFRTSLGIL